MIAIACDVRTRIRKIMRASKEGLRTRPLAGFCGDDCLAPGSCPKGLWQGLILKVVG